MQNLPLRHRGVRLLGLSVSGFDDAESRQADLFSEPARARNVRLDTVSDWIQTRFGAAALTRAAELVHISE
jgi:hypothetical protein